MIPSNIDWPEHYRNHPAVLAHHEFVSQAYGGNKEEFEQQEAQTVPNHDELVQYLYSLPYWRSTLGAGHEYKGGSERERYVVIEPESAELGTGKRGYSMLEAYLTGWHEVGLSVHFRREHSYGMCQLVQGPRGMFGLCISVNGDSGSSALSYYVLPADSDIVYWWEHG